MPVVDANGARLWYDEAGQGPAVVLLHGGLGDSGLWEPVVPYLAESFRTIRTDLRFFGRSVGVAAPLQGHGTLQRGSGRFLGHVAPQGQPDRAIAGLDRGMHAR